MTELNIAGGFYGENCIWPYWSRSLGSAGRAAAALSGHLKTIKLHTYVSKGESEAARQLAENYSLELISHLRSQAIRFDYVHSMSIPQISPELALIEGAPPFVVDGDVVVRFGMLEGSAKVSAQKCIYDPQSAFSPASFGENGSEAKQLAIIANRGEITKLGRSQEIQEAVIRVMHESGAQVVVVKSGSAGAHVYSGGNVTRVAPYQTRNVWTLGTGDVFVAAFAWKWGIENSEPIGAARFASKAVATHVDSMSLPIPSTEEIQSIDFPEATFRGGKVYLAAPFFTLGQRWLVDDARRCLREMGFEVFSPVHDVGRGPGVVVAPQDIEALKQCDVVFALLDGIDCGTIFETGFATAAGKPVFAVAQSEPDDTLKMLTGTGSIVRDDLVTALHLMAWRA